MATCSLPFMQVFDPFSWYPSAHCGKQAERLESICLQSDPSVPWLGGRLRHAMQQAVNVAPVESSQHAPESALWASVQHSSQVLPLKHPGGALGFAHIVVLRSHVAATRFPAVQREVPEGRNPASHAGWQNRPLARTDPQVPADP